MMLVTSCKLSRSLRSCDPVCIQKKNCRSLTKRKLRQVKSAFC